MEEQLTKRPICQVCKQVELTNEEVAMYKDGRGQCWFCAASALVEMNLEGQIPDPARYGRPDASLDAVKEQTKQKHFRPPIDAVAAAQGTDPAPGKVVPAVAGQPIATTLRWTEQERKDFSLVHGVDPAPKVKPTEIVVHGATEDTYMKFSIPLPVGAEEEKEIRRIMQNMLEIFGKLLKYGAQFASTLLEMQSQTAEMFLGGRK